jgi:hypothetical protein
VIRLAENDLSARRFRAVRLEAQTFVTEMLLVNVSRDPLNSLAVVVVPADTLFAKALMAPNRVVPVRVLTVDRVLAPRTVPLRLVEPVTVPEVTMVLVVEKPPRNVAAVRVLVLVIVFVKVVTIPRTLPPVIVVDVIELV